MKSIMSSILPNAQRNQAHFRALLDERKKLHEQRVQHNCLHNLECSIKFQENLQRGARTHGKRVFKTINGITQSVPL
jgi:hypothetical protein